MKLTCFAVLATLITSHPGLASEWVAVYVNTATGHLSSAHFPVFRSDAKRAAIENAREECEYLADSPCQLVIPPLPNYGEVLLLPSGQTVVVLKTFNGTRYGARIGWGMTRRAAMEHAVVQGGIYSPVIDCLRHPEMANESCEPYFIYTAR